MIAHDHGDVKFVYYAFDLCDPAFQTTSLGHLHMIYKNRYHLHTLQDY